MAYRERIAISSQGRSNLFSVASAETLAGNRTITAAELGKYQAMTFDPGGAGRNVVLPAEADAKGAYLFIKNSADGAEDLTVQNDTPATVLTISQNEAGMVWCDGTSWYGFVGANT